LSTKDFYDDLDTTEEVIERIESMFNVDQHDFVRDIKIIQDSQALTEVIVKELSSVLNTNDDPFKQADIL